MTAVLGQRRAYSRAAIVLHWLIAGALLLQLALGWSMTRPELPSYAAYQLHKSIGITVLMLTLARIAVRFARPPARNAEPGWQGRLAAAVHASLYIFMIAAPLTGWLLVSSAAVRVPTLLFGIVPWPHLPVGDAWSSPMEQAHSVIAWLGAGLIALHIAGALRHHLILRDTTLRRIWPARFPTAGLAAGLAAVIALGAALPILLETKPVRAEPSTVIPETATAPGSDTEAAPATNTTEEVASAQVEPTTTVVEAEPVEAAPAVPVEWAILPGGKLAISVGVDGGSIDGAFTDWTGTIRFDPESAQGAIRIEVKTASLTFDDASQQSMATGDGYLESSRFPTAVYRAATFERIGAGRYRAIGELSLKGVTRRQVVDFTLAGTGDRRSARGTAEITRSVFRIGDSDDGMGIAPRVNVSFNFDARARASGGR